MGLPAPVYVAFNPSVRARQLVATLGREFREAASFEVLLRPLLMEFWVTTHQVRQFETEVNEHPEDFLTWIITVIKDEAMVLEEGFVTSWVDDNEAFIRKEWSVIFFDEPRLTFDRGLREDDGRIGLLARSLPFGSLLCYGDRHHSPTPSATRPAVMGKVGDSEKPDHSDRLPNLTPMKNAALLLEFVREECNPHVRDLMSAAISATAPDVTELDLNRFDIRIDRVRGLVTIDDVTNVDDGGRIAVPLATLIELLHGGR